MIRNIVHTAFSIAAVILLATSVFALAAGDYYRWLDHHGNTVLSDRPPPEGLDYEVVSAKNTSVRRVDSETGNQHSEPKAGPGNRSRLETQVETPNRKDPETCAIAKQNLHDLTSAPRVRISDGQGGYRYLEDEEREIERVKASKAIEVYCE